MEPVDIARACQLKTVDCRRADEARYAAILSGGPFTFCVANGPDRGRIAKYLRLQRKSPDQPYWHLNAAMREVQFSKPDAKLVVKDAGDDDGDESEDAAGGGSSSPHDQSARLVETSAKRLQRGRSGSFNCHHNTPALPGARPLPHPDATPRAEGTPRSETCSPRRISPSGTGSILATGRETGRSRRRQDVLRAPHTL